MNRRDGIEIYVSENTGKTPKVLILQPCPCTSLIYLYRQLVFASLQERCQFKVRRREAVLAITDKLSVQPYIESRLDALERNEHRLRVGSHIFRQNKAFDIASDRVVILRNMGWANVRMSVPRIHRIHVLHLAKALRLNVTRHLNITPATVLKARSIELYRTAGWICCIVKLPAPIQAMTPSHISLLLRFLKRSVIFVIGIGGQPMYSKFGYVGQPVQTRGLDGQGEHSLFLKLK
ncbi:hypothetical protein D1872_126320 [compost metagenome]